APISTQPSVLNREEMAQWEAFAASLKSADSWKADWFQVARRSVLYGGSKEFNPHFDSEVDRVVDYMTAIEAALVPETDFVGRRLRKRTVAILGLTNDKARATEKLLKDMYSFRSTLVHGSSVKSLLPVLSKHWLEFEQLIRDLLVAALRTVPA